MQESEGAFGPGSTLHKKEHIANGQWVEGRGWDQNLFDVKEIPQRFQLDQISGEIPIVLGRTCGQMCIANTKALELLDLLKPQPEMEHGTAIAEEEMFGHEETL